MALATKQTPIVMIVFISFQNTCNGFTIFSGYYELMFSLHSELMACNSGCQRKKGLRKTPLKESLYLPQIVALDFSSLEQIQKLTFLALLPLNHREVLLPC